MGLKVKEIMRIVNVNLKTVVKWKNRQSCKDLPRTGAPAALSQATKDEITILCRDQWGMSTRKLTKVVNQNATQTREKPISRTAIRDFLMSTDWGRIAYRVQTRPLLTERNVSDRMRFCEFIRERRYCDGTELASMLLEHILFTDETIVELFPVPNTQNTRIRTSEPGLRQPVQVPKHGLKIMVAGGLTANGLTKLHVVDAKSTVNGLYYRTRILPFYFETLTRDIESDEVTETRLFRNMQMVALMQDGAPAHTARETLELAGSHFPNLWSKGIWPGNSPDLNPIEHLWPILQDSVLTIPRPRTRTELVQRVTETWNTISIDLIKNLVYSFPRRIQSCHNNNGGRSGY